MLSLLINLLLLHFLLARPGQEDVHLHFHLGQGDEEQDKPGEDYLLSSAENAGKTKYEPFLAAIDNPDVVFNKTQYYYLEKSVEQEGENRRQKGYRVSTEDRNDTEKDNDCYCGLKTRKKPDVANDYLIGGKEATPNEFPWIVRIVGGCSRKYCEGSLISPRLVLSSYHCTYHPKDSGVAPCDHSDERRLAVLGRHKFSMRNISTYYNIPIIGVMYPAHQFLRWYRLQSHDFAMLVLKEPAKFSDTISPICLPQQDEDFGGEAAIAAGWGRTAPPGEDRRQSPYLKSVNLVVSYKTYKHFKMFGTQVKKKQGIYQDPCSGDSGGPLMYLNQKTSTYTLIGTVHGAGYDCMTDRVDMFEGSTNGVWNKVSVHVDWIKEMMENIGEKVCPNKR